MRPSSVLCAGASCWLGLSAFRCSSAPVPQRAYARLATILPSLTYPACCQPPADLQQRVTARQFMTTEHLVLACWVLRSQNHAAIMLLHGEGGNRLTMLPSSML